ncbi:hypothetical protein OCU04_003849 [Sclerotinia nivalis]|nr:hypothetical protein OCU04_003849 [Sclerotinia nivalis]
MPISTAIWVLKHEKWMRDKGKGVVYTFSGCRVNMAKIRRKARRAGIKIGKSEGVDPISPPNLEYITTEAKSEDSSQDSITPVSSSSSNASVHSDDSVGTLDGYLSSEETQGRIWTSPERYTTPIPSVGPPTWHDKSSQDVLEIYHEGIDIWHQTRSSDPSIELLGTQNASIKFHEALFGFNYLHSPNDLKTRGAAYHLAECYAHLGQKEHFIAVLDWLGRELVRCGNKSDETNAHVVRVMDLFRACGTPKEAVTLLYTSLAEHPHVHNIKSYAPPPAANSSTQIPNKSIAPEAISEYLHLIKRSLDNSTTMEDFEKHLDAIKTTLYGSKQESSARLLLKLFMMCCQIYSDSGSGRNFLSGELGTCYK